MLFWSSVSLAHSARRSSGPSFLYFSLHWHLFTGIFFLSLPPVKWQVFPSFSTCISQHLSISPFCSFAISPSHMPHDTERTSESEKRRTGDQQSQLESSYNCLLGHLLTWLLALWISCFFSLPSCPKLTSCQGQRVNCPGVASDSRNNSAARWEWTQSGLQGILSFAWPLVSVTDSHLVTHWTFGHLLVTHWVDFVSSPFPCSFSPSPSLWSFVLFLFSFPFPSLSPSVWMECNRKEKSVKRK